MKKKVIIVEDDLMSRKLLERHCATLENLEVLHAFEDAEAALRFLDENEVDLLLLDVEMPNMSGTELLSHLHNPPKVIFTTAKQEYAFEAFEFKAADFLKKPITLPRFQLAIERAFGANEKPSASTEPPSNEGVFVRENGKYIRLNPNDILFFENVGDYVRVKTTTGSHIIHATLKSVDEKLTDPRFLKVHRSYIVNLSKIKDVDEASLVIEKTVIPISRAHRADLLATMKVL